MFPPKSFRHPPHTPPHLGDKKPERRHSLALLRPLSFTRLCLFIRLGPDRRFVFTVPVPSNNNTLADPCRLARVFSKKIARFFFTFSLGKTPFLQSNSRAPAKSNRPPSHFSRSTSSVFARGAVIHAALRPPLPKLLSFYSQIPSAVLIPCLLRFSPAQSTLAIKPTGGPPSSILTSQAVPV